MAGQVQVDTLQVQATAQQSATIADNMLGHASTLRSGLNYVMERWQGQAGDSFRLAMQNQQATLDKLITRLQFVAEVVKRGGQGFDSHDSGASAKVNAQAANFLGAPLNH